MKKPLIAFAAVSALWCGAVVAEFYPLHVKRVDSDLYRTADGLYIQTRYCYHYTYGEDAVLKWEDHAYDNKIIFDDGTTCDVVKIFK